MSKEKKKKPLFSIAASVYFSLTSKSKVMFKRGLLTNKGYICQKYCRLTASFGWEGDKDAPIAYIDGSYCLRDNGNKFILFGVKDIDGKIDWYNKEGWLPCFVSHYKSGDVEYTVENFADKVTVSDKDFVVAYSRLTVKNISDKAVELPRVSKFLIPLEGNSFDKNFTLAPNETAVLDYAVPADRFGGKYPFPTAADIISCGGFDEHYDHMKNYWEQRLEPLAQITQCPEPELINAYKAGYVYTMIVKDGDELHVGENGYDRVFDHDVLGILASLITMGDFEGFERYEKYILQNVQYPDARWKYSWVFAMYLLKTGKTEYIRSRFAEIKRNAHSIEESREEKGIMKRTNAIDSHGHWTIDNQSALTGLTCYRYICERLGEQQEAQWAENQYDSLLDAANSALKSTIQMYNINYLPISVDGPNENGPRSDPRDANIASMFLFGRWSWDAWLFGARQEGVMLDLIDRTYEHIFETRSSVSDSMYNFGGYPHGYYCSAYNAGYGSAALRGEKFRDTGIKAYLHMINYAQSGPFSWWEGIDYPAEDSPWSRPHASGGGGSCQHIWGQSTATKVLLDSIAAEKSDGTVLIGRGIPDDWLKSGNIIEIKKFPLSGGKNADIKITVSQDEIMVEVVTNSETSAFLPNFSVHDKKVQTVISEKLKNT